MTRKFNYSPGDLVIAMPQFQGGRPAVVHTAIKRPFSTTYLIETERGLFELPTRLLKRR